MEGKIPKSFGQYEVIEVLGAGGMSTVYKGMQPSLGRSVAIKVLPFSLTGDKELIDRFERESSIIANLTHPNIIQIFDRGIEAGSYYIVMEHVKGCSLDELIRERKLPIYQVVSIAIQIAKGLEHAHGKGVVHRDIKPSNILISSDSGTVKVTDFGIAKLAEEQFSDRMLTREQVAMGTADYMSPEQRRDSRHTDARTDIFSYGVLLYEVLTGHIPIGRFKEPDELRDDVPPLLNQIILRCLQQDREDRYPSFTEVIADLNRLTQKGLAYREALARMSESVSHIKKKAKTAFAARITSPEWRKRLMLLGIISLSSAVVIFLGVTLRNMMRETGSSPNAAETTPAIEKTEKSAFAVAESLLAVNQHEAALDTLRAIRTRAGDAGDLRTAAEAQWRLARIHEERKSTQNAGIAYGYFSETYGKVPEISSDERVADALYKAGMYKAASGDYSGAIVHLRRFREKYPSDSRLEQSMPVEVEMLHDHIKPSRSTKDSHRQSIVSLGRAFVDRFPGSAECEEVLWTMAEVYKDMGGKSNYAKAVDALVAMGRSFPKSHYLPLYEAAELCRDKLKDKGRARQLYQEFIAAMPGSDKAPKARDRLKKL
jgi:serine/threonine protein kinase/TolA-binding protein